MIISKSPSQRLQEHNKDIQRYKATQRLHKKCLYLSF